MKPTMAGRGGGNNVTSYGRDGRGRYAGSRVVDAWRRPVPCPPPPSKAGGGGEETTKLVK